MPDRSFNNVVIRLPLYSIDHYRSLNKEESVLIPELLQDTVFLNALYLASPQLYYTVLHTDVMADNRKAKKLRLSLLRYLFRISTRCTPFGLFAGCGVGHTGDATQIKVKNPPHWQQHTRLDMQYMFTLAARIAGDTAIQPFLTYTVNTSLYRLGNSFRFIECSYDLGYRRFELTAVPATLYIDKVIQLANTADGLTMSALAAAIVGTDVTMEDALQFIEALVKAQVLVSNLEPGTTGQEMEDFLLGVLGNIHGDEACMKAVNYFRHYLQQVKAATAAIDQAAFDQKMACYQALKKLATDFEQPFDEKSLIQTDLRATFQEATIDEKILKQIQDALSAITRLVTTRPLKRLEKFTQAFEARYETRTVPLVEALDIESGIGYANQQEESNGDFAGIIRGLPLSPGGSAPSELKLDGKLAPFLIKKITTALTGNEPVIHITDEDLKAFPLTGTQLSTTYGVLTSIFKDDQGQDIVYMQGASGPTGATWLGRFAGADPAIADLTYEIVAAEEKRHADKLSAEITHLPAIRIGNVLQRPAFRKYEIPWLASSALPKSQQLSVNDLQLTMRHGKLILSSRQHGKEVLPYLSNSHFYSNGTSLPLYYFLCDMQELNGFGGCSLDIRQMMQFFPYIPRIMYRNVILARATWTLKQVDYQHLLELPADQLTPAFNDFAQKHQLPDMFCIAHRDNELVIDRHNNLALQVLISELKETAAVTITEVLFNVFTSPVKDEQGHVYNNELLFFFEKEQTGNLRLKKTWNEVSAAIKREFMVGSEWVYFNLYTGFNSADKVLLQLQPFIQQAYAKGWIDQCFFIRYQDPQFHLRIRFHMSGEVTQHTFYEQLHPILEGMKAQHLVWKVTAGMYQRELERYGAQYIEQVEKIFSVDSQLCISLIRMIEASGQEDNRWLMALRATDSMLQLFGYELEEKLGFVTMMSEHFAREFGATKETGFAIDKKFKYYKDSIVTSLELPTATNAMLEAIARRDEQIARQIAEMAGLTAERRKSLAESLIHMQVNRLFRTRQRIYEYMIYCLLKRYYAASFYKKAAA
jgi:thiopeptide-type bacteriocin biosynthesis protein